MVRAITAGSMMHVHGAFGAKVDYTVRLSVRLADVIDERILREALQKTQRRYPYLLVRLKKNESEYFYEENDSPVVLLHRDDRVTLNSEESNYHIWAVCFWEDRLHLDFFHGTTDGTGMYRVLATLLYYYCAARYGVTEHKGILTLEDPERPEESEDPQDGLKPEDYPQFPASPLKEAFTLETDGGMTPAGPTLWDVEIPEDAFIRFTTANDASPGTMISILFARAIDSLFPERDKEIISAYVINARPMLGAEMTSHNCLTMALFEYSDRIRKMPLSRQCTVYRGKTFVQSDADRVGSAMAANADLIREAARNAPTLEGKKEVFGQMFNGGEGYVSFLVSYTGKWQYPALGEYMREFWTHPPNTFGLMAEIGAANGKIFLTIQQRFKEDAVRTAFLEQLRELGIPYQLKRVMGSDVAHFPEP